MTNIQEASSNSTWETIYDFPWQFIKVKVTSGKLVILPINIHEQNLQKKEKKMRQNSSHQKTQTKDQPFQTETFCSNTTKTELKGN